jgi:hypothetical protein
MPLIVAAAFAVTSPADATPKTAVNAATLRSTCAINPAGRQPIPKLAPGSARCAVQALERTGLTRLFHGTPYSVAAVGPWTTKGEFPRLLGAVILLRFARPVSGSGAWPVLINPRHSPPSRPYSTYTARGTFDDVTEASVSIARHSHRVVELTFVTGRWTAH